MSGGFTPIPEWQGYAATSDGRIWSVDSNWRGYGARELKTVLNRDFYPTVRLTVGNGTRKRFTVHKLIATTFLGPCPDDCDQIRHLDGDKSNNAVSNLAWGNAKSNAADRSQHGRTAKITPEWRAKMLVGIAAYQIRRRESRNVSA